MREEEKEISKELTMDLEKVKKQMHDQMPGLDWTKIPEFGETTWGEMLDGFLDEVIPKLLSSQLKEVLGVIESKRIQKFPRGERKWCIECADRITKDLKAEVEKLV